MEGVFSKIKTLAQIGLKSVPDSFFYYTLCLFLLIIISKFASNWVSQWIGNNKERHDEHGKLITEMGKCLIELTTITKVHEVHIQSLLKSRDEHKEDIETLREFYIVTYKK